MGKLIGGAPGVYLQGMPSPRMPQLSAVAGFVGIAERGPLHDPQPIQSWDEFEMVFGKPVSHGFLGDEVFGFFRNGGARCFIVRVADITDRSTENSGGRSARVDLLRAAQLQLNDRNGDATMMISAINEGRWGNRIQLSVGDGTRPNMLLTTLAADAAVASVKISVADVCDLAPNMDIRLAAPLDAFGATITTIVAIDRDAGALTLKDPLKLPLVKGSGVFGRGFKLVVRLDDQLEVFDDLSMSPANARHAVAQINGSDGTLRYLERQAQGHSILIRASQVFDQGVRPRFRPIMLATQRLASGGDGSRFSEATMKAADAVSSITLVCQGGSQHEENLGSGGNTIRVRAMPFATPAAVPVNAGDDRIVVQNADGFADKDVIMVADPANPATSENCTIALVQPDNVLVLVAAIHNSYGLGASVSIKDRFTLTVWQGHDPEPVEIHRNLSGDPASARYVGTLLAADPHNRLGVDGPATAGAVFPPPSGEVTLAGGRDPGSIFSGWYTGYQGSDYFAPAGAPQGARFGLATLEDEADIDLIAVPDLAGQRLLAASDGDDAETTYLQAGREVLVHAARCGDRLALLDTLLGTTPIQAAVLPAKLADTQTSKFGALYYPWLKTSVNGVEKLVPPSGLVAGIMARSDAGGGVARAPANEPIKDVVDLEIVLEAADQNDLNLAGINCARKLGALAVELWGARTLSSEVESRYVNVRRLLIAIKRQLGNSLRWAVFEPHDSALRRRMEAGLTSLMRGLVAGGATASSDPAAAFFVKCDEETNPPAVVAAGQIVANIGVALATPAEFILLNVRRTPDSVSVTEEGG